MQEKRYNDAKKEIRSVLLTYQNSVTLEQFLKSYKGLLGERMPARTLGFSSDAEFLRSMPDVVNVNSDIHGRILLTGIADETSEHIQKLVSKQRKSKPNNSKSNKSFPNYRLPDTSLNVREQPFLPGALRAEILNLMEQYPDGVDFSTFALAYRRNFKKFLPLVKGFNSLEGMISLITELEVKTENNDRKIYHRNIHTNSMYQKNSVAGKNAFASQQARGEQSNRVLQANSSFNIHKSGITEDVLKNFQLLLQKCPEGIIDLHFPSLYQHLTGKDFDLLELGYSSIIQLVDALPHIFKRILNPNGERDNNWVILPAKASVKHCSIDRNSSFSSPEILNSSKGIPTDAASPSLEYIQPSIPKHVDLNVDIPKYVPVFVSAIINPSLFWIQLQTDDAIEEFEKFEKDMGFFYNTYADYKYTMNDADIAIDATCVVCCPEDRQWYRAVIKSIPSIKLVNVLFVDYGSRENVPRANLRYVRYKYHDYPAYAFKAQLAGLKPPKNASSWNIEAQKRFVQLCGSAFLMASLKPFDKDTFSAYLCDTSGDFDIHLNDTLIKEGFAEMSLEKRLNGRSLQNDSKEAVCNGIRSDTEHNLSAGSSEKKHYMSRSEENNFISESKFDFLEPKVQVNGVEPNISHCRKVEDSKRYVKQVQLCADNKMYIINVENKLYMTCGDLSRLLWSEKNSSFLVERLKYKEVDVPSLKFSKEDHASLFKQCIWYKIPDFEYLQSNNSSLIVYPLDWAFNILNIFGHPSVCLRLTIQNEIRSFDPFDPIWKEFCYDEPLDLDNFEKEFEEKLSKLCVYDLKAKNEALKIKRMKVLRVENASATGEIKRIDRLQNIINRRMKQIETMCSQYSSCS